MLLYQEITYYEYVAHKYVQSCNSLQSTLFSLFSDTYHKGQKDNVKGESEPASLDQETGVDGNSGEAKDSQATPLLPPIVFEHLKASSSTLDKTSTSDTKGILNLPAVIDHEFALFTYLFFLLILFYYMCIPHNITTFVFKK